MLCINTLIDFMSIEKFFIIVLHREDLLFMPTTKSILNDMFLVNIFLMDHIFEYTGRGNEYLDP